MASEHQQTIDQILDLWEEAQAEGRYVTPREVCANQPEFLGEINEYIAALEWVRRKEQLFFSVDAPMDFPMFTGATRRISRYELLEIIGAGGFGTVWKAFDSELQREVAIKLPRQVRFDSESQRHAFFAEARNLAKLDHPNIISVYDIGQEGEQVFLVSQLVDGLNLAELIDQGRPPIERSLEIVQSVADALQCAHDQGVVHRDVKPANILVRNDGTVLLGDFGISSSGNQQSAGNRGTFSYMSPEQFAPDQPVDFRTDIFSLGMVAYQLLTGVLPFDRRQPNFQDPDQIPEPTTLNPKVPKKISFATMKSLASNPDERFQSAGEMSSAMRNSKPSRTRTIFATLAGITILSFGCVVGWNWLSKTLDRYERREALSHYSFDDPAERMADTGRIGTGAELVVRGDVAFEVAPASTSPPAGIGDVARLSPRDSNQGSDLETNAGFEIDKSQLVLHNAFTISMWFYREDSGSIDTLIHLGESSGFGEQPTPQLTIWIDEQDRLRLLSYHRFGHVELKKPELNETMKVEGLTGKWCNLTITFETAGERTSESPGRFKAFINGKLLIDRDATRFGPALKNSKSRLSFGRTRKASSKSEPKGLDGLIGDIEIWDRGLSDREIAHEYQNQRIITN